MLSETKGNAAPSTSFIGSIRDVQVNGETINLAGRSVFFLNYFFSKMVISVTVILVIHYCTIKCFIFLVYYNKKI